jgi:hypothetical protein
MMVAITENRFTSRVVGASDGRRLGAVVYAIERRKNDVFRGEGARGGYCECRWLLRSVLVEDL